MSVFENSLKTRLEAGAPAISMSVRLINSPTIVLAARAAGFHAFYIDLEHGTLTEAEAFRLCQAALPAGITPLVRIGAQGASAAAAAARALEHGAQGIIVPRAATVAELAPILKECRFPPLGCRSLGRLVAHTGFSPRTTPDVAAEVDRATLVIVMLESRAAVEQADDFARLPGVDMLMLGSSDFLREAGAPGDYAAPALRKAITASAAACRRHGKWFALAGVKSDPGLIAFAAGEGAMLVSAGSDLECVVGKLGEQFALVTDAVASATIAPNTGARAPAALRRT